MCKITQESRFKPITIVLESEFEASVLKALAGNVVGSGKVRNFTRDLFYDLERMEIPEKEFFTGSLKIKSEE